MVNGGSSPTALSTSSSHNQSENGHIEQPQSNSHQLVSPMTCRPSVQTSTSPSSSISSYSSSSANSIILPSDSSSSHKPSTCETNSYFNYTSPVNQLPLMPSTYQIQQQQHYGGPHHVNSYHPYGSNPSITTIPGSTTNLCHIQSPPSYERLSSPPGVANNQQQYFPPLTPMSSHHNEEENVGSLLRLVYSCSDNNIDPNYNLNTHGFSASEGPSQEHNHFVEGQHSAKQHSVVHHNQHLNHQQPGNLNNAGAMADYITLENDLNRGTCFDWDPFVKIDCKN